MNFQQPPAHVFNYMPTPINTPYTTPTPMNTPYGHSIVYLPEAPAQAFYLVPCVPTMPPPMPTKLPFDFSRSEYNQYMTPPGLVNSPTPCSAVFNSAHPLSPVPAKKQSSIPPGFCAPSCVNQAPVVSAKKLTRKEKRRANQEKSKAKNQTQGGDYVPGFRTKQVMIEKVFGRLSEKYQALGILESEGLRGEDTIRVHVKNFRALSMIYDALVNIESDPLVRIKKVSLPFSFRNQFQKKGFLVYLKFEEASMVPHAQKVFQGYSVFQKCGVVRETGQYVEPVPLASTPPTEDVATDAGEPVSSTYLPSEDLTKAGFSSENSFSDSETEDVSSVSSLYSL